MARKTTQAIKTRQNKLTRRLKKLPSLGQAIFLLFTGLILGTVFIFLMQHTQGPVTLDETRPVSAVMADVREAYSKHRSRRQLNGILIRFENYEQLSIDAPVADKALLDQLLSVAPGTTFDMLVHPNSDTILSLSIDGEEILTFESCMAKLRQENARFFWLGVGMYLFAAFGAYVVLLRLKLRRY